MEPPLLCELLCLLFVFPNTWVTLSLTAQLPDLQIYAVTPIPDNIDVLQMDRVPDRIKSFYRVNNIRKFRYDRPFHKGPKDKENEFKVQVANKHWLRVYLLNTCYFISCYFMLIEPFR